jgi:hypothetical protein
MDMEHALAFIAQMAAKKREILAVLKNKIELDAATQLN